MSSITFKFQKKQMLFKIFLLIFSLLKCAQCSWDEDCPYLKTHPNLLSLQTLNGKVKGECWNIDIHYSETRTTTTQVLKWMSIPYAEAPINENRFKKPKPVKPWSTEIDGTIEPKYCLQISDESIENQSRIRFKTSPLGGQTVDDRLKRHT